jgi:D-inositol-3-phosphate glycosyltransferase
VVLWVGRVARGKRLYLAVEAFAQMARTSDLDARLLVLGGPDGEGGEAELDLARRRAADLGVAGRVDFAGPVPHRQLPRWYAAADALLFTSERESFGLVVLEAQACGLPVVATAVGGVREIVADGISGRIVEEASAAALGTALRSLLREQPHRGVRAQALALRRRFSWAGTARCLLDLVASLEPIGDAASLAV